MKKRNGIAIILPVILTVCLYIVFSSKIDTKPTDAGFWMILAVGLSFDVVLCKLFAYKSKK